MSDGFHVDWSKIDGSIGNGDQVALGGDNEYQAVFYNGKVPNFEMTDYTEVPHLRLHAPGSKTVYDQPVRMESYPGRPSDPERFPLAWAAFQNGRNFDGVGTPLTEWEGITENDVRRLEINGVRTVEQLARVADAHLDGLGFGGRLLREQARAFVSGRSAVDPEKAILKDQVSKLTDIVQSLMERLGEPLPAADAEATPRAKREKAEA